MVRRVFLFVGVAIFAGLILHLGPLEIVAMLGRVGWTAIPIALTYAVYQGFRAISLVLSLAPGSRLGFADAFWIRLAGEAVQFLTFTGPFLAEPSKALLLKRRGLSTAHGFAATITEYLSYMFIGAALSVGALLWLLGYGRLDASSRTAATVILWIMAGFLLTAVVAIATRTKLLGTILAWVSRLPLVRRKLRPNMADVRHVEDLMLEVMHDRPRRFAGLLVCESTAHLVHILELYFILLALELGAGFGTAAVIEGAAKFVGLAFFFIPGQVGASEGAHTLIFEGVGLSAVAGFTVPFLRRIRTAVVAGLGLLAFSWLTAEGRDA